MDWCEDSIQWVMLGSESEGAGALHLGEFEFCGNEQRGNWTGWGGAEINMIFQMCVPMIYNYGCWKSGKEPHKENAAARVENDLIKGTPFKGMHESAELL